MSAKKRVGRNVPMFMRSSVSASFLSKNPIYKNMFRKCPNCSKFSLKPNLSAGNLNPESAFKCKERKCTLCGYYNDGKFDEI